MPEPSTKVVRVLFPLVCALGAAALLYFAQSAAIQSAPAYSTLNTLPDGTKLLFDGVNEAGSVRATRQFKTVGLQKPQSSTVFLLGVEPYTLTFADHLYFDELEKCAQSGNRVVIGITDEPVFEFSGSKRDNDLANRWGIRFVNDKKISKSSVTVDNSWKPLDSYGSGVWQRDFGKGNIVLVSQTDRLTNKGVATTEANRLLLHNLLTQYNSAVFEEAHLGIVEQGSIAGLARHYHLQGLLAGLILVAALFIWSRSVSFPPAPPPQEKTLIGADSRSLLAELMSRHLKGQLITTCVTEWNRTRAHSPAIELPAEANAVAAYSQIQESLKKKTTINL